MVTNSNMSVFKNYIIAKGMESSVEKKLRKDLDFIVESLTHYYNEGLISIFLVGGYGRDEGAWIGVEEENNTNVIPYNDYDIAVVVEKKQKKEHIKKIENKLALNMDVKWIDIAEYTVNDLQKLSPTIKNYDLKYASKFLYGEDHVLSYIPEMESSEIQAHDIFVLFKTRLYTLFGSFGAKGLVKMDVDEEFFFRNQMAKSILAIVDCVLVQNKSYNASYKERVKLLSNYTSNNSLIALANWALEEKLYPRYVGMTSSEIQSLYLEVNSLFFKYFYKGLSKYYRSDIKCISDIEKQLLGSPRALLKQFIKSFIFRDTQRAVSTRLLVVQIYLANYYGQGDHFDETKVMNISRKIPQVKEISSIESLRLKVMHLREGV